MICTGITLFCVTGLLLGWRIVCQEEAKGKEAAP